jgi:ABC-2 type transport system permease protein
MIRAAWACVLKDLRLYVRDRTGLLLSLALPVFLATIFGMAMGSMGGKESIGRVKLYVEDLDGSERSRALVRELEASDGLRVVLEHDVRRKIANGKAAAGLVVPSGYGADVAAGNAPSLKLYRDPAQEIEQQIIAGNLLPALFRANGSKLSRDVVKRGLGELGLSLDAIPGWERTFDETWNNMEALAESAQENETPKPASEGAAASEPERFDFAGSVSKLVGLEVEDVAGGTDGESKSAGGSHAVAGIAVMMVLFGVAAAGGTILEEQTNGTLTRLLLTPTPPSAILLGKFGMTFLAALLQLALLFVYGSFLFDVPVWRAPFAVAVVSVALAAAATSLGLWLAVTCKTRKQLEGLSTLVILAMSALGGSWFPLVITPEWYQKLGHFTLNAWAMDAYQGLFWYGKGLTDLVLPLAVLVGIAVVLSALATLRWRQRFATSA